MDFFNKIDGIEQVSLARTGRAAAHIHTSHCACAAKNDRAASQRFIILCMAHFDPAYIGDGVLKFH
jgi:hypothetical protein